MKKLAIMIAVSSAALPACANLITNGGFELNTVWAGGPNDVADGWIALAGSPDVWDETGFDGLKTGTTGGGYMPHVTAYEGSNWASIGSDAATSFQEAIGSASMNLGPGLYTLSLAMIYDAHNPLNYVNPGAVDILLKQGAGGYVYQGTLAANTGPDQWEVRSMQLNITANDTYSIGLQAALGAKTYLGVDDVNLVASPVPEPFTMGLAGLALATAARRRRRSSQ
ncbi:MAG: PEP-CTERM sorting domain-containing protein [Chthonomonadaceae bacterium]|nr:PEP-CTERM sorting domain-containing protein [Chthonomonadaceae bacterium]